jgi:hypothetical protein
LSYLLLDKWWYVNVEDGPDIVVHGFPIISNAPSADSSMELVYFIPETIINITVHFLFWLVIVFIVHTWIVHVWLPSIVAKIFNGLLVLWLIAFAWISIIEHTDFSWDHENEMTVIDSGLKWSWQNSPLPDDSKFHPASAIPKQ